MDGHFIIIPAKKKLTEKVWRITQCQFGRTDDILQRSLCEKIHSYQSISEGKPLTLWALISLLTANHVHKCILALIVCIKYWLSQQWLRHPTFLVLSERIPLTLFPLHQNWGQLGDQETNFSLHLLRQSPILLHLAPATGSAKGDVLPTSTFSLEFIPLLNDVAIRLLHPGFRFSFTKVPIHSISSRINLSASKDVSMHFQGNIDERYWNAPPNQFSIFDIWLHLANFNFTSYCLTSSTLISNAGTSKQIPLDENELSLLAILNHF